MIFLARNDMSDQESIVKLGYSPFEAEAYVSIGGEPPATQWLMETLKKIGLNGKEVLDYGCGFGRLVPFFCENGVKKVVGYDPSASIIEAARERQRQAENRESSTSVELKVLESESHLPNEIDASFDLAVMSFVLHYVPDTRQSFKEIARVLKPGGYIVATFCIFEFAPGYQHLQNTPIPLRLSDELIVNVFAKSGESVAHDAEEAGLVIEWFSSQPDATPSLISPTYPFKEHARLKTVSLRAMKLPTS